MVIHNHVQLYMSMQILIYEYIWPYINHFFPGKCNVLGRAQLLNYVNSVDLYQDGNCTFKTLSAQSNQMP